MLKWKATITTEDDVDDVVGTLISQDSSLVVLFILFILVLAIVVQRWRVEKLAETGALEERVCS